VKLKDISKTTSICQNEHAHHDDDQHEVLDLVVLVVLILLECYC